LGEVGVWDLVMIVVEVVDLLDEVGLEFDCLVVEWLVECMEGWFVGFYFVVLVLGMEDDVECVVEDFYGDDCLVVDYVCDVFFEGFLVLEFDFFIWILLFDWFFGLFCDVIFE